MHWCKYKFKNSIFAECLILIPQSFTNSIPIIKLLTCNFNVYIILELSLFYLHLRWKPFIGHLVLKAAVFNVHKNIVFISLLSDILIPEVYLEDWNRMGCFSKIEFHWKTEKITHFITICLHIKHGCRYK